MSSAEVTYLRRTLRESQKKYYKVKYESLKKGKAVSVKKKMANLNPVIDKDGLFRCNGRLKHGEYLPYDIRYQITLGGESPMTMLIVKSYHDDNNHSAGTNHILTPIKEVLGCFRQINN